MLTLASLFGATVLLETSGCIPYSHGRALSLLLWCRVDLCRRMRAEVSGYGCPTFRKVKPQVYVFWRRY